VEDIADDITAQRRRTRNGRAHDAHILRDLDVDIDGVFDFGVYDSPPTPNLHVTMTPDADYSAVDSFWHTATATTTVHNGPFGITDFALGAEL